MGVVTAYGYLTTYSIKIGQYSYYSINIMFIDIDISDILFSSLLLLLITTIFLVCRSFISGILEIFIWVDIIKIKVLNVIGFVLILLAYCNFIGVSFSRYFVLILVIAFCLNEFIFPFLFKENKKYLDVLKEEEDESIIKSAIFNLKHGDYNKQIKIVIIVFFLSFFTLFCHSYYKEKNRDNYIILTIKNQDFIFIDKNAEQILAMKVDLNKKEILDEMIIFESVSEKDNLIIFTKYNGKLKHIKK